MTERLYDASPATFHIPISSFLHFSFSSLKNSCALDNQPLIPCVVRTYRLRDIKDFKKKYIYIYIYIYRISSIGFVSFLTATTPHFFLRLPRVPTVGLVHQQLGSCSHSIGRVHRHHGSRREGLGYPTSQGYFRHCLYYSCNHQGTFPAPQR